MERDAPDDVAMDVRIPETPKKRLIGRASAMRFIVLLGVVSIFADMTYEGARSITGPYLGILGASATVVGDYKREEDVTMESGKWDEELSRMSESVDNIKSNSMLLLNESFAFTNEREGSEIARQIIGAVLDKDVRVFFVTHLHHFAHTVFHQKLESAIFLRAEREPDGRRTFKLMEGEPLQTSYGEDLYKSVSRMLIRQGSVE